MSTTTDRPQRRAAARTRFLAGALVDVALLVVINVTPGWRTVPFLTEAASGVVAVVDVSLAVALVVNLLCLFFARPMLIRAGEVISTAVGLTALLYLLAVFPFRFDNSGVDWTTVVRLGLISVVAVVSIALVVQLVRLVLAVSSTVRSGLRQAVGDDPRGGSR